MHDVLRYEADTEVVDLDDNDDASLFYPRFVDAEEAPEPPVFGRTSTGDLNVEVRDKEGFWHRKHPRKLMTACGRPWEIYGNEKICTARTSHYLSGPLADCECWTKAEREECAENDHMAGLIVKGAVI